MTYGCVTCGCHSCVGMPLFEIPGPEMPSSSPPQHVMPGPLLDDPTVLATAGPPRHSGLKGSSWFLSPIAPSTAAPDAHVHILAAQTLC